LILGLWNACITKKEAHDTHASILDFLSVILFEIFQISESKEMRKRFIYQYVTILLHFIQ